MNNSVPKYVASFYMFRHLQYAQRRRMMNMIKAKRRALLQRLLRLCLEEKFKLIFMWKVIRNEISPLLIMKGIQYRRIWMKNRSYEFWDSIVLNHYTDMEWLESFRMSKMSFLKLCDLLEDELRPKMQHLKAREPISVKKQVAIAIYKLASCSEYRVVGNVFGIHKSTVKKYLYRVVQAINTVMAPSYINMPKEDEAKYIAIQLENLCHIPQIIGCIDGTHIPITAPEEGYRDFVNRKGWASYNVQVIVDHNGRFRNVFAKHPGSVHDAVVFKDSTVYKRSQEIIPQMEKHVNGQKIPFMIVGDPAYPLLPWLIKNYSGSVSPTEESFNVYLNSARVSVEMAFGRLKARWRMLQKKLDCNYKFVPLLIVACCVLHNFCEDNKDRFLEEWLQRVIELDEVFEQPTQVINRERGNVCSTIIRDCLKDYFAANFHLRKTLLR